jgi:hypothetical protein
MYQIDNGTAATVMPTPGPVGPNPNGFFTSGNPATAVPATTVDADWLNAVQDELANAVSGSGQTLSKTNQNQLLQTIQFFGGAYVVDTGAVNALAITLNPAPASMAALIGMPLRVKVANTITGAATITVNEFAAVAITNQSDSALTQNQVVEAGVYTMIFDGTAMRLQGSGSASGPVPVIVLTAAGSVTSANNGAMIEQKETSTVITSFPTPVGNSGLKFQFLATSAPQTISIPAGILAGPSGSGAADLTITGGALVNLESDGVNYIVSGNFAALNGSASQAFECAPGTTANQAVTFGQFVAPLSAFTQVGGNNTTISATVSFTVPGPGLLLGWGSKNVALANSAAGDGEGLTINGISVMVDATQVSAAHFGAVAVTEAGVATATYAASYGGNLTANVMLVYIPAVQQVA